MTLRCSAAGLRCRNAAQGVLHASLDHTRIFTFQNSLLVRVARNSRRSREVTAGSPWRSLQVHIVADRRGCLWVSRDVLAPFFLLHISSFWLLAQNVGQHLTVTCLTPTHSFLHTHTQTHSCIHNSDNKMNLCKRIYF